MPYIDENESEIVAAISIAFITPLGNSENLEKLSTSELYLETLDLASKPPVWFLVCYRN